MTFPSMVLTAKYPEVLLAQMKQSCPLNWTLSKRRYPKTYFIAWFAFRIPFFRMVALCSCRLWCFTGFTTYILSESSTVVKWFISNPCLPCAIASASDVCVLASGVSPPLYRLLVNALLSQDYMASVDAHAYSKHIHYTRAPLPFIIVAKIKPRGLSTVRCPSPMLSQGFYM